MKNWRWQPLGGSLFPGRMKRLLALALLVCLTGCSNAPIAGFLDCFPSKGGPRPAVDTPAGPRPDTLPPPADIPVAPRP